MCAKETYDTRALARAAAKGISRNLNQTMEPYFCSECDKWVLRTAGKHRRPRGKQNKYPFRYAPMITEKQERKKKKGRRRK